VLTLSSGPHWRLVVAAAAPLWAEGVVAAGVARSASLAAGDGLEVTAEPWDSRMSCAWGLSAAAADLVAVDRTMFDGVALTIQLPGLTVEIGPEVLAGIIDGCGRQWWARRAEVRLSVHGTG